MQPALVIVDAINDFMHPDGALYCGDHVQPVISFIKDVAGRTTRVLTETKVIFMNDCHDPDDPEFDKFGKHGEVDTWGAEIIKELVPLKVSSRVSVHGKRTYSAAYQTPLIAMLQRNNVESVFLLGGCTHICIMLTAWDLIRARFKVYIYEQGVVDFDQQKGDFALALMEDVMGVTIIRRKASLIF